MAFFKAHRLAIIQAVNSTAEDLGEASLDMVAGFQCLAGRELKRSGSYGYHDPAITSANKRKLEEYYPSVSRCLYGGRLTDDDDTVANALAWFALEEVGRALSND